MSSRTVQQVKDLIVADLSSVEKAYLIEWLGAGLRQELLASEAAYQQPLIVEDQDAVHRNGINGSAKTEAITQPHERSWEEQPWTAAELRELMRPDPKTGAEIAAMIESGEVDTSVWAAMDIPDVVEWLQDLLNGNRSKLGNVATARKMSPVWCCSGRLPDCFRLSSLANPYLYPQCQTLGASA